MERKETAMKKKDKEISSLPTINVMGKKCWSPATCAKVIGVHRNTIINWARKTKAGELNMPIISAPVPRAKIYIPCDPFMAWVIYGEQN